MEITHEYRQAFARQHQAILRLRDEMRALQRIERELEQQQKKVDEARDECEQAYAIFQMVSTVNHGSTTQPTTTEPKQRRRRQPRGHIS